MEKTQPLQYFYIKINDVFVAQTLLMPLSLWFERSVGELTIAKARHKL